MILNPLHLENYMNLPFLATETNQTPMYLCILLLLGGLGGLLIGMKMLQESTERLATGGLKKLFTKTANSKLAGVGIGTLATMIMQSSGATTIMVVGFVNAGVMSLTQATCYIMGANIGTTITAQLVALGGLSSSSFPLTQILISFTFIGAFVQMLFKKKFPKIAEAGNFIAGLGLIFLGLDVMTTNMKAIFLNDAIKNALTTISNPFLLLAIGVILTIIAQSSSAVTSILLAVAISGAMIGGSGNGILYVILGTNIGSCSTAILSAIGSTTNGKRTAVIHLLFNLFGSIIFFIMLYFWKDFMDMTFVKLFSESTATQIAMFHTFFNVTCTIIFLPFTKVFVFLSKKLIPEKKADIKNKKYKLVKNLLPLSENMYQGSDFLDARLLQTPEVALEQAIKFYHAMASSAMADLKLSIRGFTEKNKNLSEDVTKIEMDVLTMSKELTEFLVQISANGVSSGSSKRISRMLLDISDIVRLTEVADNITGYTRHEVDESLVFSDIVFSQIDEMLLLLEKQFNQCEKITEHPSLDLLEKTRTTEDEIDNQRTLMARGHLDRLSSGQCSAQNSNVFFNLVSNLERCGDHLNFISERSCQDLITDKTSLAIRP